MSLASSTAFSKAGIKTLPTSRAACCKVKPVTAHSKNTCFQRFRQTRVRCHTRSGRESKGAVQIRKKADMAKEPIRQFINTWKENPRVKGTVLHKELTAALEELGQFYMKNGQRTPIDKSTSAAILNHLNRAEMQLPELPLKKENPFLTGIFGK